MSKPKHEWYSGIKKLIMSSYADKSNSMQASILQNAIEEANKETKELPNGDLRLHAVDEVLLKQTKTYEGVGQELHYDARTIQTWINSYINLVGRKAGY